MDECMNAHACVSVCEHVQGCVHAIVQLEGYMCICRTAVLSPLVFDM